MKLYLVEIVIVLLLLSACSSQKRASIEDRGAVVITEQRELIRKNITDPERQKKLLHIVTEIEKQSADFFSFYETYRHKIVQLNRDIGSTRQDFEKLNNKFNQQYQNYLNMLVKKRGEMKLLANSEEWSKIMARKSSFIPE